MSKRAQRRHHLRRMKSKAKHVFSECIPYMQPTKWANHLALCSKSCCGNPRKWWKRKTLAEMRAEIEQKEQERDL